MYLNITIGGDRALFEGDKSGASRVEHGNTAEDGVATHIDVYKGVIVNGHLLSKCLSMCLE